MDWFAQTVDAATRLMAGVEARTISIDELRNHPIIANGYVAQTIGDHLYVSPHDYDIENDPTGWEFHISVASSQIATAFNLIAPNLMQKGVFFKVGAPEMHESFGDKNDSNRGQAICIFADTLQDITPHIRQIERILHSADITPGLPIVNNRRLTGSSYIFYQHNGEDMGHSIPDSLSQEFNQNQPYNPTQQPDPYKNLNVSNVSHETFAASKKLLITTDVMKTNKGYYLGVNAPPAELQALQNALIYHGFTLNIDFKIKDKSSQSTGPVLVLSDDTKDHILSMQDDHYDAVIRVQVTPLDAVDIDVGIGDATPSKIDAASTTAPFNAATEPRRAQGVKLKFDPNMDLSGLSLKP